MPRLETSAGFTLLDMMITVAVGATIVGIAVPSATRAMDSMKLSGAARDVEREVQTARMKAVSNNRSMRLRLNCPATGEYRIIEVTGVNATDTSANRCSLESFPYPGPGDSDAATPGHDGPVRTLPSGIALGGPTLEFSPRGTAATVVSGATQAITGTAAITVTREDESATVNINAIGRIHIDLR